MKPNPHKPGSLDYELLETKRDIKRAKRGEQGEASLDEMRQTKNRIKREIKEADDQERAAEKAERDTYLRMRAKDTEPRQLAPIHIKQKHRVL